MSFLRQGNDPPTLWTPNDIGGSNILPEKDRVPLFFEAQRPGHAMGLRTKVAKPQFLPLADHSTACPVPVLSGPLASTPLIHDGDCSLTTIRRTIICVINFCLQVARSTSTKTSPAKASISPSTGRQNVRLIPLEDPQLVSQLTPRGMGPQPPPVDPYRRPLSGTHPSTCRFRDGR
jgi:hypothetical protein